MRTTTKEAGSRVTSRAAASCVSAGVADLRVGHGRLDRAMPEMVSSEVDVFAGVEHVDRDAVARWTRRRFGGGAAFGCVATKEVLDLAPLEPR